MASAMSSSPRPRLLRVYGRVMATRLQRASPARRTRTGPPKVLGSGRRDSPPSRRSRAWGSSEAQTSKLVTRVADRAGGEVEHRRQVGRGLDRDALAGAGLAADRALGEGDPRRAGDPPHRPQQRDERRQVVRPHVEERTAAAPVVEVGRGMPPLVPVVEHERGRRHRLADGAVVDQRRGTSATRRRGTCPAPRRAAVRGRGPSPPAGRPPPARWRAASRCRPTCRRRAPPARSRRGRPGW